jgi:antitoxin MazE
MQVSKWGNSLAIRIPSQVAEALNLKEGDEIAVRVAGERVFEVERDESRERMIDRLRALARPLPAGWQFDRDEANERS